MISKENEIGIETYYSSNEGIGGNIKKMPEDFVVEEIPLNIVPSEKGEYVLLKISSENWETNKLIRAISRQLWKSRNAITIAGTKDKRAVKIQYISFKGSPEEASKINLKDVKVLEAIKIDRGITLGSLWGNKFNVIVRDMKYNDEKCKSLIEKTVNELDGAFPNFFGIQRFGLIRPVTHLVGKAILDREWEKAVKLYVGTPMENETAEAYNARKYFDETQDAKGALKLFPKEMHFERSILNQYLSTNSYEKSFSTLPINLQMMFIHAYQSYLFNKMLSIRIKKIGDLTEIFPYDKVLYVDKNAIHEDRVVEVNESNIETIKSRIKEKKAVLAMPIVGYQFKFDQGVLGEIEKAVIDEHDIEKFYNYEHKEFSSKGYYRNAMAYIHDLSWKIENNTAQFSFSLMKGSYATIFLREIMKARPEDYG